jgi:hypothetical protein
VSRATRENRQEELFLHLQDCHLLWLAIQCYSTGIILCNSLKVPDHLRPVPTTPQRQRTWPLASLWFGLFPFRSPLLRKSRSISFPLGTMMVHFPRFAPPAGGVTLLNVTGFPIRAPPDQSLFTASRGFSQFTAPFVASLCQGIRHIPLVP